MGGHGEGGGNAFEHYFKGAMVDADTRSKPTGPMVDGPRGKGASFVFLSAALQRLFGYSSFRRYRLNCASAPCAVRRLHPIVHSIVHSTIHPIIHPRLGNASGVYCLLSLDSHHVREETGHCAASEDTLLKCARYRLLSASWLLSSASNMSHAPSLRSVSDLYPRLQYLELTRIYFVLYNPGAPIDVRDLFPLFRLGLEPARSIALPCRRLCHGGLQ